MKASELRIGNWVQGASRGGYEQATGRMIFQLEDNKLNVLPIPLTPEILEKAGFNMEGKYIWLKIDEAFELCTFASGTPGVGLYFEGQWLGDTFNYLHQIQNLFFALTGEELNIEL
jgi:hypothetical protein